MTRPPEIERQSVDELKAAARRLREAHDRAKAIGTRQAREMRGKAEPRGATPAKDNSGTVGKAQALRDALDRVEAELSRREGRISRVPSAGSSTNAAASRGPIDGQPISLRCGLTSAGNGLGVCAAGCC